MFAADDDHYIVQEETWSPDGKLGVTKPVSEFSEAIKDPKNRLVEVKTGRVIADLEGDTAWNRMNHGSTVTQWSADGSLLHWWVEGKWSAMAQVIVKLTDTKVVWQKDLVPICWKTILQKTQAADPKGYAREKEQNKGSGSAYPEGFTVDVRVDDDQVPLKLPLKVRVDLTSDPKDLHGSNKIDAWLDAVLSEDGKLTFGTFKRERRPDLKNNWAG